MGRRGSQRTLATAEDLEELRRKPWDRHRQRQGMEDGSKLWGSWGLFPPYTVLVGSPYWCLGLLPVFPLSWSDLDLLGGGASDEWQTVSLWGSTPHNKFDLHVNYLHLVTLCSSQWASGLLDQLFYLSMKTLGPGWPGSLALDQFSWWTDGSS